MNGNAHMYWPAWTVPEIRPFVLRMLKGYSEDRALAILIAWHDTAALAELRRRLAARGGSWEKCDLLAASWLSMMRSAMSNWRTQLPR